MRKDIMIAERLSSTSPETLPKLVLDHVHLADVRILAGDQFASLINRFCDNAAGQIEALRAAAHTNNFEVLRRNAHKLRGSGLVLGARALAHHAGELEEKLHHRQVSNLHSDVAAIEVSYKEVAAILRAMVAQL